MIAIFGCKRWGRNNPQYGLRIYADSIRDLAVGLIHPSRNYHKSLQDFLGKVKAGLKPKPYSRIVVVIRRGEVSPIMATATFATLPPTSVQGYITAPRNSWFRKYIADHMGQDIQLEYQVLPEVDFLIVPNDEA